MKYGRQPIIFENGSWSQYFFQMTDHINFIQCNLGTWLLTCNLVLSQVDERKKFKLKKPQFFSNVWQPFFLVFFKPFQPKTNTIKINIKIKQCSFRLTECSFITLDILQDYKLLGYN